MKPILSSFPLSKWLLRITMLVLIYLFKKDFILQWDFKDVNYLVYFALTIFSVLLIFGGFGRNSSLTVISGLIIFLLGILLLILDTKTQLNLFLGIDAIVLGFFFLSIGNRRTRFDR